MVSSLIGMVNRQAFYDRYHLKNARYTKVIGRRNFTYFYTLDFLQRACTELLSNGSTPPSHKVLDVGFGVGALSLYLAKQGFEVTGIDVSERAVSLALAAKETLGFKNVEFKKAELKAGGAESSLAICSEVIEHVPGDHQLARDLASHLQPGGWLFLSTPSRQNLLYRLGYYKKFDAEVGHLRRYTPQEIKIVLEKAGLDVVALREVEGPLRNILFTSPLGFLIKGIRGPLIPLFHIFDRISAWIFGAADIQVLARKKTYQKSLNAVLHVTPRFAESIGGVETHVTEVVRAMEKSEPTIQQSVIAQSAHNKSMSKLETWNWIWLQRHRFFDANIIHVHDVFWWLLPIYPWIAHKTFITFHGWETQYPVRWQAKLHRWIASQLSRGRIHVGAWIQEFYWDKPDAITYGGSPDLKESRDASKRRPLKIVFLGRLATDNQIELYCSILSSLKKQGIPVEMTWLGEGPERPRASRHGKTVGFVPDPSVWLQKADVVFASSYLSLLAAQRMGKVVVAGYDTFLKQRYLETYPGAQWLLFGSEAEDLAGTLVALLNQPKELKQLQKNASDFAKTMTWVSVAQTYFQLWKK